MHRHQKNLDDRIKTNVNVSYMKPLLSPARQPSLASSHADLGSAQKVTISQSLQSKPSQNSASGQLLYRPLLVFRVLEKYHLRGYIRATTISWFLAMVGLIRCGQREFEDIFLVDHFITSLRDEVRILKELPPRQKRRVELGIFHSMPPISWSNISYYLHQILSLIQKWKNEPFLVLHLQYEMDMLAFFGCTNDCSDDEVEELTRIRYATHGGKR